MGIDVLHYTDLVAAERELFAYDQRLDIGRFQQGDDQSRKIGDGHVIDGLRDYTPGDEARHIDWVKTAARSDNGISLRQFYEEKSPLTVMVSDIPTAGRFAETPGEPLSARTLGLVIGKQLVDASAKHGSPVIGAWSNGFEASRKPRAYDGRKAGKIIAKQGLEVARQSSDIAQAVRDSEVKRGVLRRKGAPVELPAEQSFSAVINQAAKRSVHLAGMARFIIMSDFRSDTENTLDLMKKMNQKNDVLAVQITNPLLREIPDDIEYIADGKGGSVVIETQAQRDRYAELQAERQEYIDNRLRAAAVNTIIVDTANPRAVKSL